MASELLDTVSLRELPRAFEAELRSEGGAAVLFILQQAIGLDATASSDDCSHRTFREYADEAYERAWERLHSGSWKSIHRVWRHAFGYACILKAQYLASDGQLVESIMALDMCLMMAGPYAAPQVHNMIAAVERALNAMALSDYSNENDETNPISSKRRRLQPCPPSPSPPPRPPPSLPELSLRFPVKRVHLPSLEEFYSTYMMTNTPVVITSGMDQWPAMGTSDASRSWQTLDYFRRVAGHRTVPIEVGSSYLEDDWGQQLMTINEFIDRFLQEPPPAAAETAAKGEGDRHRPVGYLAQHHLFDQIPVLAKDIMTPDYCTIQRTTDQDDQEEEEQDDIAVNAWFGPQRTVSPLHFDPKDNLLCQVLGAKYLRLYAPSKSSLLYPVEGLLCNTSQVDVENPDLAQFPEFEKAKYLECVLQKGEMLFIPPKYWHFVRSLSTSFSVSFWWS